tara:strand:+ start:216 stop:620 length:405 start_codon:yes stop_codon:yes gene_type:complete
MYLNDLFGFELSVNLKKKLNKTPVIALLLSSFEFNGYENRAHAQDFFEEVEYEIGRLGQFKEYYETTPETIIQLERERGNDLIIERDALLKKYSENYCPSPHFNKFNSSNRLQYMVLRIEIDKLLKIKKEIYKV